MPAFRGWQLSRMNRKICLIAVAVCLALAIGCGKRTDAVQDAGAAMPAETEIPQESAPETEQTPVPEPAQTHTPAPTETPEPTPTPEPPPSSITIGAVGDIMVMQSQVNGAYLKDEDRYDFSRSYIGVREMFRSMDLMCGNLETTLSGAEAGYSKKKTDDELVDTFNAPDALIDELISDGFDFLTTANNHALDRKMPGLLRTLDVLDEKGIFHTGTARSNAERDMPLVIDVKGFKIGIVSATEIVNKHERWMTEEEAEYAVTRLYLQQERLLQEVQACRDAGAEFIIAFPHWDKEHKNGANAKTRECAQLLLKSGVDCILGSHPHVVQSIEYVTVEREDGPYTGLVVYSMGNFISNMSGKSTPDPLKYGLFVQLTLARDETGKVYLQDACYMPTYCFYQSVDGLYVHQVVPALSDPDKIVSFSELSKKQKAEVGMAREHVIKICTTKAIPVMEDICWKE